MTTRYTRVPADLLDELIRNEGRLMATTINELGVLRLALDLKAARERIKELESRRNAFQQNEPAPCEWKVYKPCRTKAT